MRKEFDIVISAEGRDKDKAFHLTEMGAFPAEAWAMRLFLALAKSGVEVPEDLAESGMAGVATLGIKAFAGLSYADAKPLLDEMFECVKIIPDPRNPHITRKVVQEDIEEVTTLLKLRMELITLHTGFSLPVADSKLPKTTGSPGTSRPTPISRKR